MLFWMLIKSKKIDFFNDFWVPRGAAHFAQNSLWRGYVGSWAPRSSQDLPRPPQTPPKIDFLVILYSNLVDFGLQLGGFSTLTW